MGQVSTDRQYQKFSRTDSEFFFVLWDFRRQNALVLGVLKTTQWRLETCTDPSVLAFPTVYEP